MSGLVKGFDLVFYWATDLGRSVDFYREVLGLELVSRDGDNWAEFSVDGRRFALHAVGEGQRMQPGGATAVFTVGDLDEARAYLADRGVEVTHEGEVAGYARFLSFADPDGNTIQFIEYARATSE